jgi:hypothetical protein
VDFDMLGALEPLLLQQKAYISSLESELNFMTNRLKDVETRMIAISKEYERELNTVRKNYEQNVSRFTETERQL